MTIKFADILSVFVAWQFKTWAGDNCSWKQFQPTLVVVLHLHLSFSSQLKAQHTTWRHGLFDHQLLSHGLVRIHCVIPFFAVSSCWANSSFTFLTTPTRGRLETSFANADLSNLARWEWKRGKAELKALELKPSCKWNFHRKNLRSHDINFRWRRVFARKVIASSWSRSACHCQENVDVIFLSRIFITRKPHEMFFFLLRPDANHPMVFWLWSCCEEHIYIRKLWHHATWRRGSFPRGARNSSGDGIFDA